MLDHIELEKIFFLDIETVPQYANYSELPENMKLLWDLKTEQLKGHHESETPEEVYRQAGIYAEFGKIICISVGHFNKTSASGLQFRIKSFYGHHEQEVISGFIQLVNEHFHSGANYLCAHNGREFDFPYISRRILINDLKLPAALDIAGKKPWESEHLLDTMQLWRFGDFKNYTSLNLLCNILGIPTPKDEIQGSEVWFYYWEKKELEKIARYCEKDVLAIARLIMKFKGMEIISDENVVLIHD